MSRTSDNIQFLRDQGLTQTEIARRSGVPQCRISRWAAGALPKAAEDALRLDELVRSMKSSSGTVEAHA